MLQDYNLITLWYDDIVIWRCTKVVQKTKVVWNPLIKLRIEFWIEVWRTLLYSLEQRESSTLPLAHFLFHTSSSTFPLPHFSSASPLLHLLFRSSFLFFIIVNILFFFLCLLLFRTPCKKIFFQTIQTWNTIFIQNLPLTQGHWANLLLVLISVDIVRI